MANSGLLIEQAPTVELSKDFLDKVKDIFKDRNSGDLISEFTEAMYYTIRDSLRADTVQKPQKEMTSEFADSQKRRSEFIAELGRINKIRLSSPEDYAGLKRQFEDELGFPLESVLVIFNEIKVFMNVTNYKTQENQKIKEHVARLNSEFKTNIQKRANVT